MFTTYQHGEIPLGDLVEEGVVRLWSFVELEAHAPILFLEVEKTERRYKSKTMLFLSGVEELRHVLAEESDTFKVGRLYLISPGQQLDRNEEWRMELLVEVLLVVEESTGRCGVMFLAENGMQYFSESGRWGEVRRCKRIYLAR